MDDDDDDDDDVISAERGRVFDGVFFMYVSRLGVPLTIDPFGKSELLLLALLAGLDEAVDTSVDAFLLNGEIFLINLVVSLLSFMLLVLSLGAAPVFLTGVERLLLESAGAGDSLSLFTGVG